MMLVDEEAYRSVDSGQIDRFLLLFRWLNRRSIILTGDEKMSELI